MFKANEDRRMLLFVGIFASLLLIFTQAYSANAASNTEKAKAYVSDSAITTELKAKFLAEKGLDSMDIKVATTHGIVTLRGQVIKQSQSRLAEKIAREAKGVRGVNNKISVMP
ncbi:MAG: BON domain-containing protein [Desulfovibrio sp.]|jgi:osmotically-inducible protein OsmY|nr:BON domain-containing protein [Desulfovibrio sp.]